MKSTRLLMSNHPNRNWRRRLKESADQWSASGEADGLASMRILGHLEQPSRLNQGTTLLQCLRLAYLAGLRDGERREISLPELDR